jgi:hypothetical protein
MVVAIWTQCHQILLLKKIVYELEVLMGYQRILDQKDVQTFDRGSNQKKQGNPWMWKTKVCIVKDMMAIVRSNGLKFQRLFKHHPLWEEG